ncbi:MAG: deoxyhypusine synthase [Candidatus Sumerlaeia bacterium]|nr:deoxyhypusine synthase [Candidatus Sumerlaeia bacterium]
MGKHRPTRPCRLKGQMIEPLQLRGNESVSRMVDGVFAQSGFNGRRLAEACQLYSRMLREDTTVALTLAGAMTPIGMSGPIISLIENGFVDFIISTGANLYHDLHRPFGCPVVQGSFYADDNELAERGIARIYDTFISDDDTLLATDRVILDAVAQIERGRPISTAQLHNALGRAVCQKAPHPEKSFLAAAARHDVPIYCSAPGDSSIAMNLIVPHLLGDPVQIDPLQDVIETTAIVRFSEKNGAVEIGGGHPKNFYMQTQPTLSQILRDYSKQGHDYFIQLTTDAPHWGGLSGATPQEAKSWGKIKDAAINNVVVYSCASITFPILCQYVLTTNKPRKPKRLMTRVAEWAEALAEKVRRDKNFSRYCKLWRCE